jgi:hypothetical protein
VYSYIFCTFVTKNRGSSVDITTGDGLEDRRIDVRVLVVSYSLLDAVQSVSEADPASSPSDTLGFSPRYNGRSMKLTSNMC